MVEASDFIPFAEVAVESELLLYNSIVDGRLGVAARPEIEAESHDNGDNEEYAEAPITLRSNLFKLRRRSTTFGASCGRSFSLVYVTTHTTFPFFHNCTVLR